MSTLQADVRAGAVQLFRDYATDSDTRMNATPGRPTKILPPCAFVDTIREDVEWSSGNFYRRHIQAECIVIHGPFDSPDAAAQKDAFIDGFIEWCRQYRDAANPNADLAPIAFEDIPNYLPDWFAPDSQFRRNYYATQITLDVRGG